MHYSYVDIAKRMIDPKFLATKGALRQSPCICPKIPTAPIPQATPATIGGERATKSSSWTEKNSPPGSEREPKTSSATHGARPSYSTARSTHSPIAWAAPSSRATAHWFVFSRVTALRLKNPLTDILKNTTDRSILNTGLPHTFTLQATALGGSLFRRGQAAYGIS